MEIEQDEEEGKDGEEEEEKEEEEEEKEVVKGKLPVEEVQENREKGGETGKGNCYKIKLLHTKYNCSM